MKKRVELETQLKSVMPIEGDSNYEEELWTMAHEVISALSYMHKMKVPHGQIYPNKVILCGNGNYKLIAIQSLHRSLKLKQRGISLE